MTRTTDTAIRIGLLLIAIAAIAGSFAIADIESLTRAGRFWALLGLGFVVLAGAPALELGHPYAQRRPLVSSWGRPATELGHRTEAPAAMMPADSVARAGRSATLPRAGFAVALLATLVLGVIGYALAGSAGNDEGLFVYLLIAVAAWLSGRFLLQLVTRQEAVRVTTESATLGRTIGYLNPISIERTDVVAIEHSDEPPLLTFVTRERRYNVATGQLTNRELSNEIAGLWPEVPWHAPAPSAARSRL